MIQTATRPAPLTLEVAQIKNELATVNAEELTRLADDQALAAQAGELVAKLFAIDPNDLKTVDQARIAVEDMGVKLQGEAARKSAMLKEPISTLAKRGEDGGPVAKALVDLRVEVEALDPAKFDLEPGWFSRTLGFLPFLGTPLKKYFIRYESAEAQIDAIMTSLQNGRETLRRDNITLADDQRVMREMTFNLEKTISLAQHIDQQLSAKLEAEVPSDNPKYKFVQEELIFPLRQRIQDLQQQLIVNQQGVLAMEIIIRNNKELVRGVDRCSNVTVNALQVAVTVALALADQKIVLSKINMINETTDNLIGTTAKMLKEQGAAIHKQAASTMLSMDNLKEAFANVTAALEDISKFRQEALPKMAQSILEMNELTATQESAIKQMEDGNRSAGQFVIEVS